MGYAGYGNNSDQKTGEPSPGAQPKEADKRKDQPAPPSAGPHSEPELLNPDATPGTGALPAPGAQDGTDSTSG